MWSKKSSGIYVVVGSFALAMTGSSAVAQESVACCRGDGTCADLPNNECGGGFGDASVSMGPGTDCSLIQCDVSQECCDIAGSFCGWAPPAVCLADFDKRPMGPGTSCGGLMQCSGDPIGDSQACCNADGTCSMVNATSCYTSGGVPQGPDTTCAADTDGDGIDELCEVVGCCIDGAACGVILPATCEDQGGIEVPGADCTDCNGNGIADACDLVNQTSADCTGNGVPDECEPDCNENGVADSCDIFFGTSADCNLNGVPDECAAICEHDCQCVEPAPCAYGACVDDACASLPNEYGDMNHDGAVNLFDVFCGLDAIGGDFSGCAFDDVDIHPCGGNGALSILDLLAVLDAIAGADPCCGQ